MRHLLDLLLSGSTVRRARRHSLPRFATFGVLGLCVDVTLLWMLSRVTPLSTSVAVTVAFLATYALNFTLNRRFAFGARGPIGRQLIRFAPQLAVNWCLVMSAMAALTGLGIPLLPARILAAGTNAAFNYVSYRWWTFGDKSAAPYSRTYAR